MRAFVSDRPSNRCKATRRCSAVGRPKRQSRFGSSPRRDHALRVHGRITFSRHRSRSKLQPPRCLYGDSCAELVLSPKPGLTPDKWFTDVQDVQTRGPAIAGCASVVVRVAWVEAQVVAGTERLAPWIPDQARWRQHRRMVSASVAHGHPHHLRRASAAISSKAAAADSAQFRCQDPALLRHARHS